MLCYRALPCSDYENWLHVNGKVWLKHHERRTNDVCLTQSKIIFGVRLERAVWPFHHRHVAAPAAGIWVIHWWTQSFIHHVNLMQSVFITAACPSINLCPLSYESNISRLRICMYVCALCIHAKDIQCVHFTRALCACIYVSVLIWICLRVPRCGVCFHATGPLTNVTFMGGSIVGASFRM